MPKPRRSTDRRGFQLVKKVFLTSCPGKTQLQTVGFSGFLLNVKDNPDGFLSHYLSLRKLKSEFFDSLKTPPVIRPAGLFL